MTTATPPRTAAASSTSATAAASPGESATSTRRASGGIDLTIPLLGARAWSRSRSSSRARGAARPAVAPLAHRRAGDEPAPRWVPWFRSPDAQARAGTTRARRATGPASGPTSPAALRRRRPAAAEQPPRRACGPAAEPVGGAHRHRADCMQMRSTAACATPRFVISYARCAQPRVRDLLEEAILEGELKPGERLRAEALAQRFGTSRTPIREALLQLEAQGLVEVEPNRGAVVRTFDRDDLRDLYEVRALLEPPRPRARPRAHRARRHRAARRAAARRSSRSSIVANEEFHRIILEAARQPAAGRRDARRDRHPARVPQRLLARRPPARGVADVPPPARRARSTPATPSWPRP